MQASRFLRAASIRSFLELQLLGKDWKGGMSTGGLASLEQLLSLQPSSILRWIAEFGGSRPDLNWLGLGFVAGNRVAELLESDKLDEAYHWGQVALAAYRKESPVGPDYPCENSSLLSTLNIRIALMLRLGRHEGDPLLNVSDIIEWIRRDIRWMPEEAIGLTRRVAELLATEGLPSVGEVELAMLRRLRCLKNILLAIRPLAEQGMLQSCDEPVLSWLRVAGDLP
jgi:hypothetical protein